MTRKSLDRCVAETTLSTGPQGSGAALVAAIEKMDRDHAAVLATGNKARIAMANCLFDLDMARIVSALCLADHLAADECARLRVLDGEDEATVTAEWQVERACREAVARTRIESVRAMLRPALVA